MRSHHFYLGLLLGITAQVLLQPLLFSQQPTNSATQELGFNRAWAERAFANVPSPMTPTNRLILVREERAGDTKKNLCSLGGKIRLGERTYTRGIGVRSRSVLEVKLTQPLVQMFIVPE